MRAVLLIAVLLAAAMAFAQVVTPPVSVRENITAMLATVDLAKPDTSVKAEESLVALGNGAMPELYNQFTQIRAARQTAEKDGRWDDVQKLQAQEQVLDRAYIRLQTGTNPPKLIREWVKTKLPKEQQQFAEQMPEPVRISEPALEGAVPGYYFYISRIRQHPVARLLPEPLGANNLFAVRQNTPRAADAPLGDQVILFTDVETLKPFFIKNIGPVIPPNVRMTQQGIENRMKSYAVAWLSLSTELHNDGFYRFVISAEAVQLAASGANAGGYLVVGKAQAAPNGGNTGCITASLTFDAARKLLAVAETVELEAGIRPICQATKLLDADPIVRRMAEQDLLVMGHAAWDYLQERRALATPELQAAIDRIWTRILERERRQAK